MNENGGQLQSRRKIKSFMRLSSSISIRAGDGDGDANGNGDVNGNGDGNGNGNGNGVCTSESLDKQKRRDGKKKRNKRAPPAFLRWFALITIIAVFRTVCNTFFLAHNQGQDDGAHSNLEASFAFPRLDLPLSLSLSQQQQHQQQQHHSTRRRKRPPPPRRMTPDDSPRYSLGTSASSQVVLSLPHDLRSSSSSSSSSKSICGVDLHDHTHANSRFPIFSTSRILISGILSHPLGIELALMLAQTCGVQSIVGLADDTNTNTNTNTPQQDEIQPRLAYLLQTLPDIQIHRIPAPLTQDRLKEVFAPPSGTFTHIVHLDTTLLLPFPSSASNNIVAREDTDTETYTPPIFGMRHNIHTLEQIFEAVVTSRNRNPYRSHSNSTNSSEEPHLVYVTTAAASTSLEQHHHTVDSRLLQQATNSMFHVLAPTFRSLYRVHAAHLKLPYVYGPFQDGAAWMTNALLLVGNGGGGGGAAAPNGTTQPDALSQNDDKQQYKPQHKHTPWIHVTDAIQAIATSLSTGIPNQPEPVDVDAHLIVPKNRTTTLAKLERAMEELHGVGVGNGTGREKERDYLQFMLAWNYKKVHPFGSHSSMTLSTGNRFTNAAINFTNSHLSHEQINGISSLQRRQNNLFPCLSECSSPLSPCQTHSAFDSVVPVSQKATFNCRFALYMVDFSRTLVELPQVKDTAEGREPVGPWPKNTLCQIAFVAGKSTLVTQLVEKEKNSEPSKKKKHTADFNGQLVHNGWTLVWVEHDDADTLSEADYMMPKVAPGGLFSTNITRAFYLEPKSYESLPPLPMIWYLMAKQLDVKSKTNVKQKITRGRKVYIPFLPSRRVALFIHLLVLPDYFEFNSSFDTLTRYILSQKGLTSDRPWPRRQLEFYSHVFGMTHGKFPFEWVDTSLIIHNLEAKKSRLLRCEWYEEHLFWSDRNDNKDRGSHRNPNRNLEDLSLAYIIGKWRNGGKLVDEEETRKWGERVLEPGDLLEEQEQQAQLGPDYRAPSQYFLRLSKPMKVRTKFE
jgi:hypothetical protein